MADEPSTPQPEPGFGHSRFQLDPDDTPTLPNLFARGNPPPGFWEAQRPHEEDATPPGTPSRPEPVVIPPAGEDRFGIQVASTLPPRAERRRGALMAVGLVALATVVVVAAALLIGPHLGGGKADGDQQAGPPVTPATTSLGSSAGASTASAPTGVPTSPPAAEQTVDGTAQGTGGTAPPTSVVTVTVTAGPRTADATRADGGAAMTRATAKTTGSTAATSKRTPKTSTASPVTTTAGAANQYGVPVQQIACGDGYIVQLASELTRSAFAARIAELKGRGLVPADAKAADSTKSCKLFTNQTNTLILYAGPFRHRYDACDDRLSGPYDAFIRGASPGSSGEFVSCICPASVRDLPRIDRVGAHGQWIGELQRMLAAHLRFSIPDLGIGSWGIYTKDTRAAVKRFQSDHRVRATGTVNAKTWRALQRAGC